MKKQVLAFIKHFQNEGTIKTFTNGCCYWFAHILMHRFDGTLMYNPVENHFATKIGAFLFDITGEVKMDENWVMWYEYAARDWRDAERVYYNCMLKIDD